MAKNSDHFHIVYLGENGFPFGFGAIQKMTLISKALIDAGAKVTILNRKGKFDPLIPIQLAVEGDYEGIHYIYTAGSIYRPAGFLQRNWQKFKGSWQEFQILRKLKKDKELSGTIVSSYSAVHLFLYLLYGYWLDFPVVLNYVEMISTLKQRDTLRLRINDYFLERFLIPRMDAALPISALLEEHFKKKAPGKAILKIPIICDFDRFNVAKEKGIVPYYLYCGAIEYQEVIDFIIHTFELLPQNNQMELHLVAGGSNAKRLAELKALITASTKADVIKVFNNIPDEEIPIRFAGAKALLIPLRPTLQDMARFPHKIGEYLATGNPVITTNVGEINNYFIDGETALVAEQYDQAAFAKKMQFVFDEPEKAEAIGANGKELGLAHFNYLSYGSKLKDFMERLN